MELKVAMTCTNFRYATAKYQLFFSPCGSVLISRSFCAISKSAGCTWAARRATVPVIPYRLTVMWLDPYPQKRPTRRSMFLSSPSMRISKDAKWQPIRLVLWIDLRRSRKIITMSKFAPVSEDARNCWIYEQINFELAYISSESSKTAKQTYTYSNSNLIWVNLIN